jgi:hypothetical protein
MKIKISIEGTDIKLALDPDSELEKLVLHELGDNISFSRSHQMLVLRRRANHAHVRTIEDSSYGTAERAERAEKAERGEPAATPEPVGGEIARAQSG